LETPSPHHFASVTKARWGHWELFFKCWKQNLEDPEVSRPPAEKFAVKVPDIFTAC